MTAREIKTERERIKSDALKVNDGKDGVWEEDTS